MSKFKIGDKVKFKPKNIKAISALDSTSVYMVKDVDHNGNLSLCGVYEVGWFPENFELCKHSIVKDIIADL